MEEGGIEGEEAVGVGQGEVAGGGEARVGSPLVGDEGGAANTLLREIECGGGDGVAQAVTSLAVALVVSVEM